MTGGSIHQLFEEQARRAPDRVAVVTDGDQYTYLHVDTEANRLAAYLTESGALPDSGSVATVAICSGRRAASGTWSTVRTRWWPPRVSSRRAFTMKAAEGPVSRRLISVGARACPA